MLTDFGHESRTLIRQSFSSAQQNQEEIQESFVGDILEYLSRRSDVSTVRDAMRARFATGITKTDKGYETYSKGIIDAAIFQGYYEAVSSGLGNKIINTLANLFTMPTQSWQYIDSEGNLAEDVQSLINKQRELGSFATEIITADRISSAVESCPVLVQMSGGNLTYQAFSPACIYPVFAAQIEDNGQLRGTNQLDLEDAICVVVKLASSDNEWQTSNFLAIFGRSQEFEYGRYVQYQAQNWKDIPMVGNANAVDYLIDGQVANPLSFLAAKNPDRLIPEYPIIILRGGHSLVRNKLIEVNSSLYDSCIEVDLAYSRILKDVLAASTGSKVVRNPSGEPLPKTLEGSIVLNGNQAIEVLNLNAGNCQIALTVVGEISKSVASGFSVPDHQIVQSAQAESGIALYIKSKPLIEHRQFRAMLNGPQINKLFQIEKGIIELTTGQDLGDVEQIWDSGSYDIPEDQATKVARIKAAMDSGLVSYVQAIKLFHNLATDQQAMQFIEQMRQQDQEFPIPKSAKTGMPSFLQSRE
jgi:hypothetical protein